MITKEEIKAAWDHHITLPIGLGARELKDLAEQILRERDEALRWKEALLEISIDKCFLGVAQPIGEDLIERLKPKFRMDNLEEARRIVEGK